MGKQPHVWVVEVLINGEWVPTAEAANSEAGAKRLCRWCMQDGFEAFKTSRVVKYEQVKPEASPGSLI